MAVAVVKTPYTRGAAPELPNGVVILAADGTEATPATGAQTGAVTETAPATDTASSGLNGRLQRIAQRLTSLIALLPASLGAKTAANSFSVTPASDAIYPTRGNDGILTCLTSITRPSDTNAYAANDCLSDSTSAPTTGGFTFTSAARASGKSVILTDLLAVSSNAAATPLQGELWIFDTAVTNVNDNAAFAISDGEALTVVARIPFAMTAGSSNNNMAHVQNLNIGILTVASANLRFLVKVINAYTPASAEVISFRAKFLPVD